MRSATHTYKVSEIINAMWRNYPGWPSTFSKCKCGVNLGRGGGLCADCLEKELADLIGKPLAWEIHQTIKTFTMLKNAALYGEGDEVSQEASSN